MIRRILLSSLLLLTLFCTGANAEKPVFQYSTIDALLTGLYDGDLTIQRLKSKGDFGLGTLNGLDGELIVLDGEAYHCEAGGKARIPSKDAMVPFAAVCFFQEDTTLSIGPIASLNDLNTAILNHLPTQNIFYAIRIDADFRNVKTRAIPKQSPPYEPLAQLVKKQVITSFSGKGTLVGLFSPSFVKGIGVPQFHWHFLTKDRTGGGHVLNCQMGTSQAHLDFIRTMSVQLPTSTAYDQTDLTPDRSKALHRVEQDHKK